VGWVTHFVLGARRGRQYAGHHQVSVLAPDPQNPHATYACINFGEAIAPVEIAEQSIVIDADIDQVLSDLLERSAHA
jgi:hypothetical protein